MPPVHRAPPETDCSLCSSICVMSGFRAAETSEYVKTSIRCSRLTSVSDQQLATGAPSSATPIQVEPGLCASGDRTLPRGRSLSLSSRLPAVFCFPAYATRDRENLVEPVRLLWILAVAVARWHSHEPVPAQPLLRSTCPKSPVADPICRPFSDTFRFYILCFYILGAAVTSVKESICLGFSFDKRIPDRLFGKQ